MTVLRLLSLISAALLSGCSMLTGTSQPTAYYVLADPGSVLRAPSAHPGVLLLSEMDAPSFYQKPRLAFSRIPGTRSNYEFAHWTELPGKRLTWLLLQRIEASGAFDGVASMSSGIVGDYQLNTRLIDFYHDAATDPGNVLLLVEAELVGRDRGRLLDRRIFVAHLPVSSYDAAGAALAMDRAAEQVINDIVIWLSKSNADRS